MRPAVLAALAALACAPAAAAAGDAAAGKAKLATCVACHGEDGRGTTADYPNLGGQSEKYLAASMRAYKSGGRKHPVMTSLMAMLSGPDIDDIAAWYASQPCK